MLKGRLLTYLTGALLVVGIGFGVVRLIALRLEKGDVYPPLSTLRADPLGAKVLYDALAAMPDRSVSRNFRPLRELQPAAPVTLVYAGVERHASWGRDELQHFEGLIANGSRAVFAFAPANIAPEPRKEEPAKGAVKTADKPEDEKAEKNKADEPAKNDRKKEKADDSTHPFLASHSIEFPEVSKRWGATFQVAQGKKSGSFHGLAKRVEEVGGLDEEVSWHSALRFTDLQPTWRIVYRALGEPVVIERQWGDGTIVLVSDSFFLSNEALQKEPVSGLIAWLLGSPGTVIFDEEHLGVSESTGIASLVGKYRLEGGLAALGIVAVLWLWMESSPLIPPHRRRRPEDEYVTGLDSQEGFVSLLRRTIPVSKVLDACVNEWRKTFSHDVRASSAMDRALAASETRTRNAVTEYARISAALHEHSDPAKATTHSLPPQSR